MAYPDWLESVYHAGTADYLSNICPFLGEHIEVYLRTASDAPVQQIMMRTCPNGEQQFTPMVKAETKGTMQFWRVNLKINENITPYRFGIQTDQAVWWLNAAGISLQEPFSLFDFKLLAGFHPISWLRDAVFYQIFPDRFANGDPNNDPVMEHISYRDLVRNTFKWGQPAPAGEHNMLAFYGGDLQGISQKLGYLQNLGVNAIYLNPIFSAFSNHRYDVTDYDRVDPVLGGDEALITLRKELDDLQMHMILDIVPNHCGFGHPWFQSALKQADSVEAGFFYFDHHPDVYESWMGHSLLPKLNYASHELRRRMYLDENSIVKSWLNPPFSADGWRVDVANMLGRRDADQVAHEVIPEIRKAVKDVNQDAYLVGENFFEASSQLQGDGWDGVMNYAGFCNPLLYWLIGYRQDALGWNGELRTSDPWPTETLLQSWRDHLAAIPWQIALQQFNLLDSHDTHRIRTILNGNESLHRLAAILQFTFPGVPCIYYGDEIGLVDDEGFGSRNCMPWDKERWNKPLFDFYRSLIAFRKGSDVLKNGNFQILHWEKDFFIYQRNLNNDHILISANRSFTPRASSTIRIGQGGFDDNVQYTSLFGEEKLSISQGYLVLSDLPQGGAIWFAKDVV
jgi:alpha-glucosidase